MKENIDIFDFEISTEDMTFLNQMKNLGGVCKDPDNLDIWTKKHVANIDKGW